MKKSILAALICGAAFAAQAQDAAKFSVTEQFKAMFKKVPEGWAERLVPDETLQLCSDTKNSPSKDAAEKLVAREVAAIVYPADGNVLGDWANGEKLAQNGYGGRFTDTDPKKENGGNCYACHELAAKEIAYGTVGPSLKAYGKLRDFKPEAAKAAYAKIYNPHATLACSLMPRFGHNKFLTEAQMKDVTAFLMSPDSPVNK